MPWVYLSSINIQANLTSRFLNGRLNIRFTSLAYKIQRWIFLCLWHRSRTSEEMDRTLHTDFAKSRTTWDILTKISALLQLWKIWFLTKFEGCSSKIGPTTPMGSFIWFWLEIQIFSTYDLDFLCNVGFHRG